MVPLSAFEDLQKTPDRGICHITFDDGDRSFYETAFPVLRKHSVPATVFVSPKIAINRENFWFQEIRGYDEQKLRKIIHEETGNSISSDPSFSLSEVMKKLRIQTIKKVIEKYQISTRTPLKPSQNMTDAEIIETEGSGIISFGAHTLNHPILKNEEDRVSRDEITGSITGLENMLGHKVKYFAYPNGRYHIDFDIREVEYLNSNGISIAVSTETGYVVQNDHRLILPRIGITYGSLIFIKSKLLLGENWKIVKTFKNRLSKYFN